MASQDLQTQQLQSAFRVFNHQSELLEGSYRELQNTVAGLTRRLQAAQRGRQTELSKKERLSRRLADLLESLPGAILVIDDKGVIRQQNSEASELLHQPLIGHAWASIIRREISNGRSQDGNIQLRDGRWFNLARRGLKSGSGEILHLTDVTEERQLSELRQRNERLTAIGEMTAEFAHQVRTPLASTMLYAGQLSKDTPQQERVVGKIVEGLNDLKRMVSDMLGFAAGAKRAHESVNVTELLTDVRASIKGQLKTGTVVSVSATDNSLRVAANRDALKGALLNLVMNADQATDGPASILLHGHRFSDSVHLCVADNGPGIDDAVKPRLFEPFFTTRPQGTGLGLAVVKAVVAAHGGEVAVHTSDLGTNFSLQLPAEREED
ncbi:MAG: ATP-binding protein [Woeseiaceae bacterium]|nr:ATP-binding protein [Woeseiaceae bacterium]